ncbi:MAG: glycosyltransferase family 4 protein [Desulfobacteraceae bacterium]|nr:glycosyltransferase family 4 protein [Desulfobacteraceae bacterium]
MKILVVSNLYPPYFVGGYELGCREVVEGLKEKGHKVRVLTSTYGIDKKEHNGEVYRWLKANFGWKPEDKANPLKLIRKEINNQIAFIRICSIFNPDVVYFWNLEAISVSLVFKAQSIGLPISFAISDNWLSEWERDLWYSFCKRQPQRLIKKIVWKTVLPLLKKSGLLISSKSPDLRNVHFNSRYLQEYCLKAGKPVANSKVIYRGIYISQFPYKKECAEYPKHLLYAGQIVPHKGVHTVIESLRILVQKHGYDFVKLTVVGGSVVPDYEANIRGMVSTFGLEKYVHFTGQVSYEKMSCFYKEHEILIFSSIWDEPLSHTLFEGMSSGLAVVSTLTGGTPEILQDEYNALIFPKQDAEACASQIIRLIDNQELFKRIRLSGRHTVEVKFRSETRVEKIEKALQDAIANR